MTPTRDYLFYYLKDEFARQPSVRVRILPHQKEEGVNVRTETREYLFEYAWVEGGEFSKVRTLVGQIKELLGEFTA